MKCNGSLETVVLKAHYGDWHKYYITDKMREEESNGEKNKTVWYGTVTRWERKDKIETIQYDTIEYNTKHDMIWYKKIQYRLASHADVKTCGIFVQIKIIFLYWYQSTDETSVNSVKHVVDVLK